MAQYYNQLQSKVFMRVARDWWKKAKPFYDVNRFRKQVQQLQLSMVYLNSYNMIDQNITVHQNCSRSKKKQKQRQKQNQKRDKLLCQTDNEFGHNISCGGLQIMELSDINNEIDQSLLPFFDKKTLQLANQES